MSGDEELLQINSIYDDMSFSPYIKRLYDAWYNKYNTDPELQAILQTHIPEDLKNKYTLPKTLLLETILDINSKVSIDKAETLSEIIDRLKVDGFNNGSFRYPADTWDSEFDVNQTEILLNILNEDKIKIEKEFSEVLVTYLEKIKSLLLLEASRLYHAYNTILNINTYDIGFTSEEKQDVMMYAQLYKLKGKGNEYQPRGLEEIFKDLSLVLKYVPANNRGEIFNNIKSVVKENTLYNVFNEKNSSKILPIYNEVLDILDKNIQVSVVELNINVKMFLKFKNIFLGMIQRFQYLIEYSTGVETTNVYIEEIRNYINNTIDGNLSTWTGDKYLLQKWEEEAIKNNTGQNIQSDRLLGGIFIDNCVGDDILTELVDEHKFVKLCSYSSIVDPGDQCTLYNQVMESVYSEPKLSALKPFIENIELQSENYFQYSISAENNNNPGLEPRFKKNKRAYPKVKLTSALSLNLNLGKPLPQALEDGTPFKPFTLNGGNSIDVISEIVWNGKTKHNHSGPLSASTICLEAVETFVELLTSSGIVNENINDILLSIFFKKTLGDLGQELEALRKGYGFVSNDRPSFVRYAYLKKIQIQNYNAEKKDLLGWGGYTPKQKNNSVFIDSIGNYIKGNDRGYITQGVFYSSRDNSNNYEVKLNLKQYKTLLYLLLHDLMHDYYGFGDADSYTKTGRWTVNGALFPIFSDMKMQKISSKMNIEVTSNIIQQIQADMAGSNLQTVQTIQRVNKIVSSTNVNDQISSLPLDEDEPSAKRQKVGGYKQKGGALDTNTMIQIAKVFYDTFINLLKENRLEDMTNPPRIIEIIIVSFQTWIQIAEVKQILYYDIEEIISILNILIEDPLKYFNIPEYVFTYIYALMIYICTTYKINLLKELIQDILITRKQMESGMNLRSSGLKSEVELTNIYNKILNTNLSSVIYNSNIIFIPLDIAIDYSEEEHIEEEHKQEKLPDNYSLHSLIKYIEIINELFWKTTGDNNTFEIIISRLHYYILEQIEYERRNNIIKSSKLNKRKIDAIERTEFINLEIIKKYAGPGADNMVQKYAGEITTLKNIIPEDTAVGAEIFKNLNESIQSLTGLSYQIRERLGASTGGGGKKIKKKTKTKKKKKKKKKTKKK